MGLRTSAQEFGEMPETGANVTLLQFEDVGFRYPKSLVSSILGKPQPFVVNKVNFELAEGKSLGLVGESGSGKTTLAKIALGLHLPKEGRVQLCGTSLSGLGRRELSRIVQPVFQDPMDALDPRMTIGSQVEEPLVVHRFGDRTDRRKRALNMLARVGLGTDVAQRYPHEISGGQAQRAVIARALVIEPKLVVCDEPTSALDTSVQLQILNLLKDLQRDTGIAYLFISHDLRAVAYICHDAVVLHRGQVVEAGAVGQLLSQPRHPYTRSLLAAIPKTRRDELTVIRPHDSET